MACVLIAGGNKRCSNAPLKETLIYSVFPRYPIPGQGLFQTIFLHSLHLGNCSCIVLTSAILGGRRRSDGGRLHGFEHGCSYFAEPMDGREQWRR